jgi:hypothetical protein
VTLTSRLHTRTNPERHEANRAHRKSGRKLKKSGKLAILSSTDDVHRTKRELRLWQGDERKNDENPPTESKVMAKKHLSGGDTGGHNRAARHIT